MSGTITMTGEEYDALRAEAESLRAENGRMQADRDRANQYANQQALECNKLSTDLEAARGLLRDMRIAARIKPSCHYGMVNPCRCGYCTDLRVDAFLTATTAPEVPDHTEQHLEMAEQGERQEAVAWALANSADEIGGFAPIYYTKEGAISWANGRNIFPLYTTPQPGQDVRGLVEALEECAASLAWNCLGECRAIHAGPIMPAAMALDTARAALAAHRQAQSQA